MLSRIKQAAVLAFEKGFRVTPEGVLCNRKGTPIRGTADNKGRLRSSVKMNDGRMTTFQVHHLAAICFFGTQWLDTDLVVRHLDGQRRNNSLRNLALGTVLDNNLDIPPNARRDKSAKARTFRRGALLTQDQKARIVSMYETVKEGERAPIIKAMAAEMGVARSTVRDVFYRHTKG